MAIIDSIKTKLGEVIYPKTLTKAVFEEGTNKRLDLILRDIIKIVSSPTEPTLNVGDQWHKEV